jgi:hypothetical protein
MNHKEKLEELNKAAVEKLNDYLKNKEHVNEEHKAKLHAAKHEWQTAWNKVMEALLVLERIEI